MAVTDAPGAEAPKPRSRLPLLLGLALAPALGVGGFHAVQSGMILAPEPAEDRPAEARDAGGTDRAVFVPVDPTIVSLGTPGEGRHLRFRAELEVVPGAEDAVRSLMPRVLDVLNGYLRAVPLDALEGPASLSILRAQMLRRVQLVVGPGQVRDLLVTEFVLN